MKYLKTFLALFEDKSSDMIEILCKVADDKWPSASMAHESRREGFYGGGYWRALGLVSSIKSKNGPIKIADLEEAKKSFIEFEKQRSSHCSTEEVAIGFDEGVKWVDDHAGQIMGKKFNF